MSTTIADLLPNDLPEYWVYAVNVSYDQDEEQVKKFFSQCGQVVGLSFVYDRNGSKKGHVRVAYRKKADAIRAISDLHNMRYAGRAVKLNWDKSMVIRNSGASPEKVSEMLKKAETNRFLTFDSLSMTSNEPDEYINRERSQYQTTLGFTIDRLQENPYAQLFKNQLDPSNFPFIIPKST